ncbi:MAG: hypothetical protein WDO56_24745 [Gammaproteobacteria bacterium]
MSESEVLIHVRFAPDGAVTEIGERPAATPAQEWFNVLTRNAGEAFQPLSGGRGVFRVPRDALDGMKTALAS